MIIIMTTLVITLTGEYYKIFLKSKSLNNLFSNKHVKYNI